jgi:hypothetical protein
LAKKNKELKARAIQAGKAHTRWAIKQGLISEHQRIECTLRITTTKVPIENISAGPQPPLKTSIRSFFTNERGVHAQVPEATVTRIKGALMYGHLDPGASGTFELRTVGDLIKETPGSLMGQRRNFGRGSVEATERMLKTAGLKLAEEKNH